MATSKTGSTSPARKPATRKPAEKTKTAPTAVPPGDVAAKAPVPTLVSVTTPVVAPADLRKKELIDLVVERSGAKKRDAKPAIEATLAVLGEMLASGRELNLPPLGKVRINRVEEKANGRVIICKLRQPRAAASEPKDTLADSSE